MEIFSNSTIIRAIIGALVSTIASATFAIIYEHVKFNKKKKGAYALIQSEINYMNDGLMLMRSPFTLYELHYNICRIKYLNLKKYENICCPYWNRTM